MEIEHAREKRELVNALEAQFAERIGSERETSKTFLTDLGEKYQSQLLRQKRDAEQIRHIQRELSSKTTDLERLQGRMSQQKRSAADERAIFNMQEEISRLQLEMTKMEAHNAAKEGMSVDFRIQRKRTTSFAQGEGP